MDRGTSGTICSSLQSYSEDKAQTLAERFKDVRAILGVLDAAYDCGIHAFMLNTHDKAREICGHLRANPQRYADLRLYPSLPYAYKYANAVNEKGIVEALNGFLFAGRTAGEAFATLIRGGRTIINRDLIDVMKLLVDAEMRVFRGLNVRAVFLQNIVSDLLCMELGSSQGICDHFVASYGVDPDSTRGTCRSWQVLRTVDRESAVCSSSIRTDTS
jgi:hypothetical protein